MTSESAADPAAAGPPRLGTRLPVFFQAEREPRSVAPLRADGASPARFALRVVAAAARFAVPAGVLLSVSMVCEALVPLIVGAAIDQAVATGDAGRLLWWLGVLAVDFLALTLAFRFGSRVGLFGMQQVQHRLRTQVVDRLLHPAGAAHGHADGAALSIATSDVHRLAATIQLAVYPTGEVAAVLFAAAALFWISPPLGVAVLVGSAILVAAMFLAGGRMRRRSAEEQELGAEAVDRVADLLAGYRVLKGLRAEDAASARYREASRAALGGTLRAKSAQGSFLGGMDAASGLFTAALTVIAGLLALDGRIGIGGLVAAVGLIQYVVGPLTALPANTGAIWARSVASSARVLSVLQAAEAAAPGSTETRDAVGSAPPAALSVSAAGARFRVEVGECVGVVADQRRSGSLIRLLSGRPRPGESGTVLLDGVALDETGIEHWRRRLLVAPHRAELFDGSIAANLDVPDARSGGAPRALWAAACEDIVEALRRGLDAAVGEGGVRLSGGQRQRIALARAYAADAPVLVLHDPTTAVDAATEQLVASRLRAEREGRTTVIVASSPALLSICDRVIVIRGEEDRP